MTNLQAAIGCGQLKNIFKIIKRKREIGRRYISILNKCKKIFIQPYKLDYATNIFWVFGILLKKNANISRDQVVKKLLENNIQTRTFFFPMHKQKIFKKMKLFSKKKKFINAEYLSKNGFYLPSGLGISNSEIDFVGKTLAKILENNN
jgi:perosamine synthetase